MIQNQMEIIKLRTMIMKIKKKLLDGLSGVVWKT